MRLRVVIIEDDPETRNAMEQMITLAGYEVFSFEEPLSCPIYTTATCECPQTDSCGDFLITDNNMPGMTGLEFLQQQQLRGCKGALKNKAVISGDWSPEKLETAQNLGCKIFRKPVNFREVLDWLKENGTQPTRIEAIWSHC